MNPARTGISSIVAAANPFLANTRVALSRSFCRVCACASARVRRALFAVVVAASVAFYDVALPSDWVGTFALLLVGAASFCVLGLAVSTVVPNVDTLPTRS